MSKHTPGPWIASRGIRNEHWIDAPRGDPTLGFSHWACLAVAYGCDDDEKGDSVASANAALIASAPDLLLLARDALAYNDRVIKSLEDQGVAADPELVELTERVRKVLDVIDGKEAT